ncbi:MAG: hypothetical protein LKJ05_02755 [Bifidobacteriaceae bacterium]|jgi:hypothetical protein|nr:hypothetical protein [Bifidobacteriaceae bacterium]
MGGRGASSASDKEYSHDGKTFKYGDEYETKFVSDGMKFIQQKDSKPTKAPIESQTPGRIYATLDNDRNPAWQAKNRPQSIHDLTFVGSDGRVSKQIHTTNHGSLGAHAHEWKTYPDGTYRPVAPRALTADETRMLTKAKADFINWRKGRKS